MRSSRDRCEVVGKEGSGTAEWEVAVKERK